MSGGSKKRKNRSRWGRNDGIPSLDGAEESRGSSDGDAKGGSLWERVDVGLPEPEGTGASSSANHYGDGDRDDDRSRPERDLEGRPGEEMGFFFGLEVIPPEKYRVEEQSGPGGTTKRFRVLSSAPSGRETDSGKDCEEKEKETNKEKNSDGGRVYKKKKRVKGAAHSAGEARVDALDAADCRDAKRQKLAGTDEALDRADMGTAKNDGRPEEGNKTRQAMKPKNNSRKKKGTKSQQIVCTPDAVKDEEAAASLSPAEGAPASSSTLGATQSPKEQHSQDVSDADAHRIQMSWLAATGGVTLCVPLCRALKAQNFERPTPIQAATLAAAILGRRNIVGAAPTGSGKTLAFLLPICQYLLEEVQQQTPSLDADESEASIVGSSSGRQQDRRWVEQLPLQALILTPTRELALQIHKECEKLLPRSIGTIVGGLAHAKQTRVLEKKRPPILVGTPGRLWELVRSGDESIA